MPLIFQKKKKWTTNKYLIEACIFQNSFKLNLFQKSKCQNFKLPYKYLYVSQKLMGLFIYRKLFKNSWDIFLKNVHKISGLFFEFFSQENHGIFVLWKQNYFAVPIDVPLVGSEKSGELKKKKSLYKFTHTPY